MKISDVFISTDNEIFNDDEFQNTLPLHKYLSDIENEEENVDPEVNFVFGIIDYMNDLRFLAEELHGKHSHKARDRRKALPLCLDDIADHTKDRSNPPVTIISKIAQQDLVLLEQLLPSIKKVLKRNHKTVAIGKVQQLDSRSLTWLTRQPGLTAAQKAGSRQQILAVVREESFDTPENRVLKSLFKLCIKHSRLYIKQHDEKYNDSPRLLAVRSLLAFCRQALMQPEFAAIGNLKGTMKPNYVLLHDKYYRRVWQLYQDLVQQERFWEEVWQKRHLLFSEFCRLAIMKAIRKECSQMYFQNEFWFHYLPQDGQYIEAPQFFSVGRLKGGRLSVITNPSQYEISFQCGKDAIKTVQLLYLPNKKPVKVFPMIANQLMAIVCGNANCTLPANVLFVNDAETFLRNFENKFRSWLLRGVK